MRPPAPILEFNIVSVLICLALGAIYLLRKRSKSTSNRLFFMFLVSTLLASLFFTIFNHALVSSAASGDNSIAVKIVLFLSFSAATAFSYAYILLMALFFMSFVYDRLSDVIMSARIVLFIPYVLVCLFAAFSRFMFDFLNFPMLFGFYSSVSGILNISMAVFYIAAVSGLVHRFRSSMKASLAAAALVSIFIIAAGNILGLFFPELHIPFFATALTAVLLFTALNSSEGGIDPNTGVYKRVLFVDKIDQFSATKTNVLVLLVHIADLPSISASYGIDVSMAINNKIAEFMNNLSRLMVYAVSRTVYGIIIREDEKQGRGKKDEYIEVQDAGSVCNVLINTISSRFSTGWIVGMLDINLSPNFMVLDSSMDFSDSPQLFKYVKIIETHAFANRVVYGFEVNIESSDRVESVKHAISKAVAEKSFMVYYQPIYSTSEKKYTSAEALVRLNDSELGFIPPDEFIPIAEETGQIVQIGDIVFESVCRMMSQHRDELGSVHYVEVNLSPIQCMQENMADSLIGTVEKYGLEPSMINLEITETTALYSTPVTVQNIKKLIDSGFTLSLDDYGTGYANMMTLVNLPYSIIKLDKEIIWSAFKFNPRLADGQLHDQPDERSREYTIMKGTLSIINEMKLNTVAEGIETHSMVSKLAELGCTYLQGFYFSKPVNEDDFLRIINESDVPEAV